MEMTHRPCAERKDDVTHFGSPRLHCLAIGSAELAQDAHSFEECFSLAATDGEVGIAAAERLAASGPFVRRTGAHPLRTEEPSAIRFGGGMHFGLKPCELVSHGFTHY